MTDADLFETPPNVDIDSFVEQLEEMMLAGHSSVSVKRWMRRSYPTLTDNHLMMCQDMIRKSWIIEQAGGVAQMRARQDFLRKKYLDVYEAAMREGKYLPAVKALDSVAKMDGLSGPDINVTQVVAVDEKNSEGLTTNGVRARILELSERMRLRAEQRANEVARLRPVVLDVSANGE